MDGTLVTGDRILTEHARQTVHRQYDADFAFANASGRPPHGMRMLSRR